MLNEIRETLENCFEDGETVYLIGKRSSAENPQIIKAIVQHYLHDNQNVGIDENGGVWFFNKKELNKSVFKCYSDAEIKLKEKSI